MARIVGFGGGFVCSLAMASAAHATVYWSDSGNDKINTADNLLTSANTGYMPLAAGTDPCGVAVDEPDDALYYGIDQSSAGTTIGMGVLSSKVVSTVLTGAGGAPCDLTIDGSHLYWSVSLSTSLGRSDFPPTQGSVNTDFITGITGGACGVAVDAGHIYWGEGTAIGRANLDGTSPNHAFITGLGSVCGVAVNATHVYWADGTNTEIGRADLDGSNVDTNFIDTATSMPCGLAANNQDIYWADNGNDKIVGATTAGSALGQVNAAGFPCGITVPRPPTCPNASTTVNFGRSIPLTLGPCNQGASSFAIDSGPSHGQTSGFDSGAGTLRYKAAAGFSGFDTITWYALNPGSGISNLARVTIHVKPSNRFTIWKPSANHRSGTARLPVKVPGKGKVVVSGKGVKGASVTAHKKGTVRLTVKSTGKARGKLAKHGRVSLKVKVTFTPTGGDPRSKSRSVKLVKDR